MTKYNSVNVKLSNSLLDKLKLAAKTDEKVSVRQSINIIGNTTDKTNFPHKLLLTNEQVSRLCKAFAYNSSATKSFLKKSNL